ncbi:unnamed protein product [Peronospora belbahrii]|uniref:phytol kinase n=1 Tax=Peronospora belbahrii TaxID=622444 RepID=A0AAU9L418_9STRA|nr:unnamed protein product [Peronospora belbahrii]
MSNDATTYMEVVTESHKAMELIKSHELEKAEVPLRDILERTSSAGFDQVSIALTKHELGSVLRRLGALDEALELLTAAFKVRDCTDKAAGITIALRDGNLTRDEIGKVYEAMGDYTKALDIRQPGTRICSNETCEALDYTDNELHACSRCKCVFYCGKICQWQDWKTRHKSVCQDVS